MKPVEVVLSKLRGAKRNGSGWVARCPAHKDRCPSLSIAEGDDGCCLLHCFAGCEPEAVAAAIGLQLSDLMPKSTAPLRSTRRAHRTAAPRPVKTFATALDAADALERAHGKTSATWTYRDAHGEAVGMILRWDTPAGKDIRPVSKMAGGGWALTGMIEPRPLYSLPDLLARPSERVYVCEGEKAAAAAASVGLLATTSPHGAKSARKAGWATLAGRDVVVLPDNDPAGRRYAAEVARILTGLTPPAMVRVVDLPGLPAGGDFVEYLEDRDSVESEDIRAEVERLSDAAQIVGPSELLDAEGHDGPVLARMADIKPREIRWLWPGRVPLSRISLLVGRPGEGKSMLALDAAARVSTGRDWPDGSTCPCGSVILISAEDDPADTIRPRLDAAGADVSKIYRLALVRRVSSDGRQHEKLFNLADLADLEAALKSLPDCRLVVVDPIGSFLGGDTDAHRDNEVRAVLAPVAKLAEKYGPAVLVVAHRRKSSGGLADDLAIGSRAFTGIARVVWHLSRDVADPERRLLLAGKNNLAPEGGGLAFAITGDPPALAWDREPVHMSADAALAAENAARAEKPGPEPDAQKAAAGWLRDLLEPGPMAAARIKEEATAAGLAWRTVQRAAESLSVLRGKDSFGGGWTWGLPAEGARPPKV